MTVNNNLKKYERQKTVRQKVQFTKKKKKKNLKGAQQPRHEAALQEDLEHHLLYTVLDTPLGMALCYNNKHPDFRAVGRASSQSTEEQRDISFEVGSLADCRPGINVFRPSLRPTTSCRGEKGVVKVRSGQVLGID